jgi:predicted enzyme related to lactoylglutathione lyase
VAAHTVSAQALDQYLTAVARAQAAHPNPDGRHRVEHAIQVRDDQLARMGELGMIASIQPGVPGDLAAEAGFPELVARGQSNWIARWRDLVKSDVRTIGSTDMPWLLLGLGDRAKELPHGSPLEAIHQAVTRQTPLGRTPEDWQLEQRLTVDQALRLFTIDAAYGTFEEDVKGSLAPGKYADLVVLSGDPTAVPVDALLDIDVLATVVGGGRSTAATRRSAESRGLVLSSGSPAEPRAPVLVSPAAARQAGDMERVVGIGGHFMRAADPGALSAWYRECLGLDVDEHGLWQQEAGPTVLAAFESETDYFGSRTQQTMLNFRVRDLDAMLAQLRAAGADVTEETQDMDGVGRFGWVTDPEGNRIELWQPA